MVILKEKLDQGHGTWDWLGEDKNKY